MEKGQKLTAAEFISYCREVVAWNKVSRGEHDFSDSATLKQLDYCLEEIQETVKGYEEDNLTEILDGLADSLVTLSYLLFLCREGKGDCFDYLKDSDGSPYLPIFHSKMEMNYLRLNQIPCLLAAETALRDVLEALNDLSEKANISGVVEEVLDSNWSKFPYLDQVIPMEECKWIEENRGKEGVYHAVIGHKVVFRDKGGKIVKPSTFKEPNINQWIYEESNVATNVSQEIKIGSVLKIADSSPTESSQFFEVTGVDEDKSVDSGEPVYNVRRCFGFYVVTGSVNESWIKDGTVTVLQGDEDDEYKVDISDQVASIREKIKAQQEPSVLDIKPRAVTKWDGFGNLTVTY